MIIVQQQRRDGKAQSRASASADAKDDEQTSFFLFLISCWLLLSLICRL